MLDSHGKMLTSSNLAFAPTSVCPRMVFRTIKHPANAALGRISNYSINSSRMQPIIEGGEGVKYEMGEVSLGG